MTKREDDNKPNPKKELMIPDESKEKYHKDHYEKKQSKASSGIQRLSPFDGLSITEEKTLMKRLSLILVSLTLAVLVTLYIISPLSKLDKIVLSGLEHGNAEEVIATSGLQTGKSLWPQYFNQQSEMSQIVKKNKRIKSADMKLKKLNHFYVTITEYQTVAIVNYKDKSYPVLENGKVVEESLLESDKQYPVLINFEEGENLDEFLKAYKKFSPEIKGQIETIESLSTKTNPFRVTFKMKDGNEVIGLSTTIADKMAFYDKIAGEMKEPGVIDMEAGASGVYSYPFKKTDETENTEDVENTETSITGVEDNGMDEYWNE